MARSTGCTVAGETWCFRKYAQAASPVISDVQGDPGAFDWLETGLRDVGTTSVWGRVLGGWSQTAGDANAPGSNQYISGLVIGADRVVNRSLLLGLATQVSNTQLDFRSSPNDSSVTSVQLGGYFSYGGADAYLNGNVSVSGSAADTKRFFNLGPKSYRIESSSNSWFYASSLEVGKIFEARGFRLEPNAGISATLNQGDAYTETGGGGLDLRIEPADSLSLRSSVGVRVSRVVTMNDRKIVPELRVSWRHEWLDRRQEFDAAFAGAPAATFRVVGQDFARDSLGLGTGLTVPLAGILTGYFDAEGSLSRDTSSALISLGARATW
jgi:outer membrane autotransporter protein